jgi:hypothetical protein
MKQIALFLVVLLYPTAITFTLASVVIAKTKCEPAGSSPMFHDFI